MTQEFENSYISKSYTDNDILRIINIILLIDNEGYCIKIIFEVTSKTLKNIK